MEKWAENLENYLENRTTYAKMNTIIENGKANKYEVPEHIKEQMDKAFKGGKEIKKSVQGSKFPIEVLL